MNEFQIEEILDFRKVITIINRELYSKKIFDIEYMLVNNSIEDVTKVLQDNSDYYNLIKDDKYSNGAKFKDLVREYFECVKKKYKSMLIVEGKNNSGVKKYYDKLKEPTRSGGTFIQYSKNDIDMIQQDVDKTLLLMREAILAYYKVYHNKELIAELTTNTTKKSEQLEFEIKEEQLLHLLGVTANQLRSNPDFIRLTGKSNMSSVDILEWIVRDIEGNNDLMQYNEEFMTRILNDKFKLTKIQFDTATKTRILNYHKVRTKSQTFLKYGPFEKVSLVAKLQNGKKLAVNSRSNTAIISRAECFKQYPWAYFGSVQTPNDKYIETLIIDSANGKKELFKGSKAAIIKGVYPVVPPSGSGSSGIAGGMAKIFSEEEQFGLFYSAYEAFSSAMNFENLKEYFTELLLTKNNNDKELFEMINGNEINGLISQIYNLNYESLELLYNDIIKLTDSLDDINYYDNNLKESYQSHIIKKLKHLTQEQISDIQGRIVDDQYIIRRHK